MIAAISGRALAASARRAGYRALVADMFCDTDTVALAQRTAKLPGDLHRGIDGDRLMQTLEDLAEGEEPLAVVCGSGFERRPGIVDGIARRFHLAGNGAEAIRRVKSPERFAADCAALAIPHPEITRLPPPDPENWLAKTEGAAGGTHIHCANGMEADPHRYFQRLVRGDNVSALFIGDGKTAQIIGFSRQFAAPRPDAPYRYGGALRLQRFDRRHAAMIGGWLAGLTRRIGLVGLCSADLIRQNGSYQLLEINPRPGATLDIFDSDEAPLMEAHLQASRGKPFVLPRFTDNMASMIAYTNRPVDSFPSIAWPDWTADRQSAGTRLDAGDPVCTVFARGPNATATRRNLDIQLRNLQRHWQGVRP
ncbi:ATP-grasp domain-containing protein [Pseudaminobacter arsenicus]|uniref:ATP-grasp domain-containing protein n=1 Tax=Borborobacter arsenicus TaxID=1851146 RepID=A0A432V3T4_9HYPH|nr:ATP-grasp domain-containing protein [Pseudaminobacter arsenicus]RUM96893.1 ATP-grasp domain-containing protein [Pseudaminobacter arsenicus]